MSTGSSDITSYILLWDANTGTVNIQLSNALVYTYTVSGLTAGNTYLFQVQAVNIYGSGTLSTQLSVIPSDIPDTPGIATVTLSTTNVVVDWTAPADHSSAISAYKVEFLKSDGSYTEETSNCLGTDSGVISATQCTIPMTTLQPLLGLAVDTVIQCRISAQNANGWSGTS